MKYCVAIGNPFDGMTLYGPFDDFTDAEVWAEENDNHCDEWWVVSVHSSDEDEDKVRYQ